MAWQSGTSVPAATITPSKSGSAAASRIACRVLPVPDARTTMRVAPTGTRRTLPGQLTALVRLGQPLGLSVSEHREADRRLGGKVLVRRLFGIRQRECD